MDAPRPVVVARDVTKTYRRGKLRVPALRGVSLVVNEGEFAFLIGASGSGKTTLVRLLTAEEPVDAGTLHVAGSDLSRLRPRHAAKLRRSVGTVYQDYKLLSDRTVSGNVAFALEVAGETPRRVRRRVDLALDLVGLTDKAGAYPRELSGGQQQRTAIARALVNRPKLLLCDEPTGNLDPQTSVEITKLLLRVNQRVGTTVIMATHDAPLVDATSARVVGLADGEVVRDDFGGGYGGQ